MASSSNGIQHFDPWTNPATCAELRLRMQPRLWEVAADDKKMPKIDLYNPDADEDFLRNYLLEDSPETITKLKSSRLKVIVVLGARESGKDWFIKAVLDAVADLFANNDVEPPPSACLSNHLLGLVEHMQENNAPVYTLGWSEPYGSQHIDAKLMNKYALALRHVPEDVHGRYAAFTILVLNPQQLTHFSRLMTSEAGIYYVLKTGLGYHYNAKDLRKLFEDAEAVKPGIFNQALNYLQVLVGRMSRGDQSAKSHSVLLCPGGQTFALHSKPNFDEDGYWKWYHRLFRKYGGTIKVEEKKDKYVRFELLGRIAKEAGIKIHPNMEQTEYYSVRDSVRALIYSLFLHKKPKELYDKYEEVLRGMDPDELDGDGLKKIIDIAKLDLEIFDNGAMEEAEESANEPDFCGVKPGLDFDVEDFIASVGDWIIEDENRYGAGKKHGGDAEYRQEVSAIVRAYLEKEFGKRVVIEDRFFPKGEEPRLKLFSGPRRLSPVWKDFRVRVLGYYWERYAAGMLAKDGAETNAGNTDAPDWYLPPERNDGKPRIVSFKARVARSRRDAAFNYYSHGEKSSFRPEATLAAELECDYEVMHLCPSWNRIGRAFIHVKEVPPVECDVLMSSVAPEPYKVLPRVPVVYNKMETALELVTRLATGQDLGPADLARLRDTLAALAERTSWALDQWKVREDGMVVVQGGDSVTVQAVCGTLLARLGQELRVLDEGGQTGGRGRPRKRGKQGEGVGLGKRR